jgi:short-subunit dehydrogenase
VLALSLSLHKELAGTNVRIQAVLPGATATNFFDAAGQVPGEMMMPVDDLVDAALGGLDQGELVTIPSLPDAADWRAYEAARQAHSEPVPAGRCRTAAANQALLLTGSSPSSATADAN